MTSTLYPRNTSLNRTTCILRLSSSFDVERLDAFACGHVHHLKDGFVRVRNCQSIADKDTQHHDLYRYSLPGSVTTLTPYVRPTLSRWQAKAVTNMARLQRARGGCLTCKQRKKKCDLGTPSCENCVRLQIACGGYKPRLLWEDDPVRQGIRRRGPSSSRRAHLHSNIGHHDKEALTANTDEQNQEADVLVLDLVNCTSLALPQRKQFRLAPSWQHPATIPHHPPTTIANSFLEHVLWDHYINCFARIYPTHSEADNPFLSCLAPAAIEYEPVRWILMAIAGLHAKSRNLPSLDHEISHLRLRALKACLQISSRTRRLDTLKSNPEGDSTFFQITKVEADDLCLVTTAALLAVFGKLSGEVYGNIQPYLEFAQEFLSRGGTARNHEVPSSSPLHLFLHDLVSYNQLLALVADARLTSPSCNSLEETTFVNLSHRSNPNFADLLYRISENVQHVSTLDIDCWDGKLDFLPSFSMKRKATEHEEPSCSTIGVDDGAKKDEEFVIGEIYRLASRIYFFKQLRDRDGLPETTTTLAYPPFMAHKQIKRHVKRAMGLFRLLSDDSQFNTAILLPLGMIAPQLTSRQDQAFVIEKLKMLKNTQCFDVFRVFSQDLQREWALTQHSYRSAFLTTNALEKPVRLLG
ncbi:hypothetical protein Z517_00278 [Fonsecaea pedrosoi CBS 271.37]|uniref:Zn(2)-C6 fungal-type domain-containing protein n=1 Tax=Fonsecaea pedrosoi CBS 271.37 TaxID=1442368 RepID=A0A0D2H1X8_9EURO|nr:uncharacterized protein Z517_00278 [Fonsecaea pedrosoi CBS 271.37]KIW84890.1 hypothetical protein Z517_00278 [Fonsecaea pedrosoi CBS 271.37]